MRLRLVSLTRTSCVVVMMTRLLFVKMFGLNHDNYAQGQTIYAAGRGAMATSPESAAEVIVLSNKPNPRMLYLGTASYDNPQNALVDTENYVALGCSIQFLNVSWSDPSQAEMMDMFNSADIILISGGNTLFAVDRWVKLGIDILLRTAALEREGVVLAGGSAGFISLCNGGHSDSMKPESYKNPVGPLLNPQESVRGQVDSAWEYIRSPGIGLIDSLCCPHYDTTQNNDVSRAVDFSNMNRRHPGEHALAVDEWAALVIENGATYRIISRANHTGSVAPADGSFAENSTGIPGVWTMSVDVDTGEMLRSLVPPNGRVTDIIHHPRWIVEDAMIRIARKQNPDDGLPATWANHRPDNGSLQPHHFVIMIAVSAMIGAIARFSYRARNLSYRYRRLHLPLGNEDYKRIT